MAMIFKPEKVDEDVGLQATLVHFGKSVSENDVALLCSSSGPVFCYSCTCTRVSE